MDEQTPAVVDAQVVAKEEAAPAVNPSFEAINAQKANFTAQLDAVKKEMADCQQRFEKAKVLGTKLEGALESLELLLKSLQK